MRVLRTLARPMLASIFIIQGYDTLRQPERVAPLADPVVQPLAERVPAVPANAEQAVRINGAIQLVAGSLLALGRWPRLSAFTIAATLVPTTIAGHRFWEAEDEKSAAQQRIHFLKNLTMFGGLLIAAADTAGNPSLAWRARHTARSARNQASLVARTAKVSGKAGVKAGMAAGKAGTLSATAGKGAAKAAKLSATGGKGAAKAAKLSAKAGLAATRAGRAGKVGVKAGKAGVKTGMKAGKAGAKVAKGGALAFG